MKRINNTNEKFKKLFLIFMCCTLLLVNFCTFVSADNDNASPEYLIGSNREEVFLDGEWKWTISKTADEGLPEILPEGTIFENSISIPSYTYLPQSINEEGNLQIWYEKTFSLPNRPGESVIIDYGTSTCAVAVFVNNMRCDTQSISKFLKIGENKIVLVKEFSKELGDIYHFTDQIKLIFSNAPVITSSKLITDFDEGTLSLNLNLYNARENDIITDINVEIFDKDNNVKGSYKLEDIEVLKGCNTKADVTGIKIEGFSNKTTWMTNKPYVYNAKISISGDSVTIPFCLRENNLLGTDNYKYGMDIKVSEFFSNSKNTGFTWNEKWVESLFSYFKDFNWNVITYREGELPEIWHQKALEYGILIVDKNDDQAWAESQDSLWTKDVDFIAKSKELMGESHDSYIIPVVYDAIDGLFSNSPAFEGISKIRLQNTFKTNSIINNSSNEPAEDQGFIAETISYFKKMIQKTFIKDNRYQLFLTGLGNTLLVTAAATLFGIIIGIVIAIIKVLYNQNKKSKKNNPILSFFNFIAEVYTAIIRGTPVVVQLLITYNVIFVFSDEAVLIGIFAFSINSGAYISEIIRAGINSVDKGQTEAGRSLGLSQFTTMKSIVLPQALKNILPALGNEFIALLKETSVIGYLGVVDLTRAGELVRSRTADAFFTLIFVAIIYFILVFGLSTLIKYFERRLNKSDKH